ncbi:MAG: GNAT family N-acetyltransferase [Myxococcota bacterium]
MSADRIFELTAACLDQVARWGEAPATGWTVESLEKHLRGPHTVGLGLRNAHGCLQGILVGRRLEFEAELDLLWVAPHARRVGHGRQLLSSWLSALDAAGVDRVFLEVGSGNLAAVGLYRKLGFVEVGQRAHYYGDRDAQTMRRSKFASSGKPT